MMKARVLAVDDDSVFLKVLAGTLRSAGYLVSTAFSGQECLDAVEQELPDLLITDIQMPGILGTEVCYRLKRRSRTAGIPVLIMTLNDKEGQEITCLDRGADDYMVKPFAMDLLLAHCRALLRRPVQRREKRPRDVQSGRVALDFANKKVLIGDEEHSELTPREFELLYELVSNSPRSFSRAELYRRVWRVDPPSDVSLKTVEVHVRRIRSKLGWGREKPLGFISGRGYFFKAPA